MKKRWYRSKGMWAGILLIGYGLATTATELPLDPDTVLAILVGLGIIGIRQAQP